MALARAVSRIDGANDVRTELLRVLHPALRVEQLHANLRCDRLQQRFDRLRHGIAMAIDPDRAAFVLNDFEIGDGGASRDLQVLDGSLLLLAA